LGTITALTVDVAVVVDVDVAVVFSDVNRINRINNVIIYNIGNNTATRLGFQPTACLVIESLGGGECFYTLAAPTAYQQTDRHLTIQRFVQITTEEVTRRTEVSDYRLVG
jgi:hypothetical protein